MITILVLILSLLTPNIPSINTYEIIHAADACFTAKKFDESTIFNAPKNGTIYGIQLIHLNGWVKCSNNGPRTNWGCQHDGGDANLLTVFLRVTSPATFVGILYYPTTNTKNVTLYYPTANPSGGDWLTCSHGCTVGNYKAPPFDAFSANFTLINPVYEVTVNDQFMLQYCSGCCPEILNSGGSTHVTYGNDGTTCAAVYFLYEVPTTAPTTEPTTDPTIDPTVDPTVNPTSVPTTTTSLKDGRQLETTSDGITTQYNVIGKYNDMHMMDMLIIILATVVICGLCCIVFIVMMRRKKNNKIKQNENISNIEQENVETDNTMGTGTTLQDGNVPLTTLMKSADDANDVIAMGNDDNHDSDHSADGLYIETVEVTNGATSPNTKGMDDEESEQQSISNHDHMYDALYINNKAYKTTGNTDTDGNV